MKVVLGLLLVAAALCGQLQEEEDNAALKNNYPIRLAWVNRCSYWYGDNIAKAWGVPGFAPDHIYNTIVLTFWSCSDRHMDMVLMWQNAGQWFGDQSSFGKTTDEIQKNLRKTYNKHGIKILVSAFGDSEWPTTGGKDPVECGTKLGKFVVDNNLDGADNDWEDNAAMEAGKGEEWNIAFTKAYRAVAPAKSYILTHSPQAPYFKADFYKNHAYVTVHKAVGSMINWYNVQFYNQAASRYDTYETLFIADNGPVFNGTAFKQIVELAKVPARQLVVGKPASTSDASNTGYMEKSSLSAAMKRAYNELGYYSGVAFWQYFSDASGDIVKTVATYMKEECEKDKTKCV